MTGPLLEAAELTKRVPLRSSLFHSNQGWIEAVQNLNLTIQTGETVAIVGESGCGKSTLARLLCRLLPPTAGSVRFQGEELKSLQGKSLFSFRRNVQMIFQDPMSSLNPLMKVGQIIGEPFIIHHSAAGTELLKKRVQTLMQEVGLDPAWINRFPSTFSGGQRQRVGIDRALALDPQLLICDEPVSSLDLSVQAQILALLTQLQKKRGLTLFFVSHNLATVSAIADRILVMKDGRIVEEGTNPSLFHHPKQSYTRLLVELAQKRL